MHWHLLKNDDYSHLGILLDPENLKGLVQDGISIAHLCFLVLEDCEDAMDFIEKVLAEEKENDGGNTAA